MFPSSIAAYGMPDLETKAEFERVKEWEWNYPTTMYGANKLYCEMLGIYFSDHFKQLAEHARNHRLPGAALPRPDQRLYCPSGGTSDYGPEMLHAAAKGEPYDCFVREDTTIPFMAMPDAIKATIELSNAPAENLNRRVYNISAFSLSAADFRQEVLKYFPEAQIGYQNDAKRQKIVDSWPMDSEDSDARKDWGWSPDYDMDRCFAEYLVPNIKKRYEK